MTSKLPERGKKRNYGVRLSMAHRAGQSSLVRVTSTRLPTMFGVFDLIGFERANVDRGKTESALLLMLGERCSGLCAVIAGASWNSQCRPLQTRDRVW